MEISDIVLGLLSIIVLMLGWFFSNLATAVKNIEDNLGKCQQNLPLTYVLKDDYKEDIAEIKHMLSDMYGIIRKNGGER